MNCKRIQEMMGAYLYGDLAPDELREVRLHAQECPACREDLESRGRVLAAISANAPELSEEERSQIAWAVRGAIRNGALVQTGFRWGYAAAVATVVAAALGVAAIMVYNSSKTQPVVRVEPKPAPVVSIQEEPAYAPPAPKPVTPPQTQVRVPETSKEPSTPPQPQVQAPDIRRQLGTIATITRHERHKRNIAVEKPAPVVEEPQLGEPSPSKEGEKLPKPTNPNDAQIAPE
ncbi:MAG: zf-HC2 domain-containing protein [Armatimonadota bacterium]